jgi:hypothetical protein
MNDARRKNPMTTCNGCASTWSGLSVCHCSICHRTFTGLSAFDKHRLRGQCCNPADRGLVRIVRQAWAGWGSAREDTRWQE